MTRKTALAAIGAVLCICATSAFAKDQLYKIAFDVSYMGKPVGSPVIVVRDGVPGSMELSGPDGYKLTFTATDAGGGKIKIATDFTSPKGSSSPVIILKDGQSGSASGGQFEFKFVASRHGS